MDQGQLLDSGSPAELIARHIEPEVVEVSGDEAITWLERHGRSRSVRTELVGETVFCYGRDARPLLEELAAHRGLRYLHRPANLEDVFLKLTGRELRE